eukprot:TRINITY_DN63577_c1_g3_i1.p1 TRINITY_DN63577_c1_g3~~TRINITY_DN63577_c1_g3_i1.p1  ORF type:complete len:592 (+),score=290.91 TRINITY_DN63577_c1_g3_i1:201-1778(+)
MADGVTLSSAPASVDDGEDVVISWSGVAKPSAYDFITVSCGPTVSPGDYLDRANVTMVASSGSQRFQHLINMRCDYLFTYVSYNGDNPTALATVTVPMRASPNAPQQGHLAFGDNEDEMWVLYTSGSKDNAPQARWGLSETTLSESASGTSRTYAASDMCNMPSNVTAQQLFRDPGFMHAVLIKGLKPHTRYYYQFGNDQDGWSKVHTFMSRQPAGADSANFVAYADMGTDAPPSAMTTALRAQMEVDNGYDDFLLHFGDISYARGTGYIWEYFFRMLEPLATRVPYMVSIGNHEYDHEAGGEHDPSGASGQGWHPSWGNMGSDSRGECAVPIVNRFAAPSNGHGIFWYSFDVGPVHVMQFSSEHDWTQGSVQYQWMEADLAAVNRSVTPWVVVTSHRMMYTTQLRENNDYIVSEHMKLELEPLFYKYKVNLQLTGHQHSFEASCPVYKRECVESGEAPVHVVIGSAGAGLESGGFSSKLGNWSVSHLEHWGYLRLAATQSQFRLQYVQNDSGEVYYDTLLKPWF